MASTIHLQTKPGSVDTDVTPGDSAETSLLWSGNVCVCACVSGSGLNSAPKARHFNIFREALKCQTRQNDFRQIHNFFFLSNAHEIK